MRIALAQINFHAGNIDYNVQRILSALKDASEQGAGLVVFSELSVCGYPVRDLLLSKTFIDRCLDAVHHIAAHCTKVACIVGAPERNNDGQGKGLFNAAYLLAEGRVEAVYRKGLLPTYDVFNEYRYFEPARDFRVVEYGGERIALTVCEDVWNVDGLGGYPLRPPDILGRQAPTAIINISASPFAWDHLPKRLDVLAHNAKKYQVPVFSANQVGGQTDLLFDGSSAVLNPAGRVVDVMRGFGEDLRVYDTGAVRAASGKPLPGVPGARQKCSLIRSALVMGIRDYFAKSGLQKAILGLSGGIDSAVTLVLAAEALGPENLWAVLLPGPYSSSHSVSDALVLAENLGVRHNTIPICDVVSSLEKSLHPCFEGTPSGIAEENLQARARGVILMGLSNKFGHLLLNTSNKSEAAVGYTTLYGDMCGGLSVLGDVYKTDVYGLARLINADREIIPAGTISKPPSAELKPGQKDEDTLPPYELLDAVLERFLDRQQDVADIVDAGYDHGLVSRIAGMVCASEHKRFQSPPILRVSPKCLGIGREMPLEADYKAIN